MKRHMTLFDVECVAVSVLAGVSQRTSVHLGLAFTSKANTVTAGRTATRRTAAAAATLAARGRCSSPPPPPPDATHVCCAWRSAAFSDCAFGRSSFVKCFRCARGCSARRLGLARHGGFVAWSARQSATRGLPLRTSHARVDRGRRRPRVARTSRNARRALVALAAAKEQGHLDTPRAPVCVASRFILPPARCSAAPSSSRCAPAKGRRVRAGA